MRQSEPKGKQGIQGANGTAEAGDPLQEGAFPDSGHSVRSNAGTGFFRPFLECRWCGWHGLRAGYGSTCPTCKRSVR